MFSFVAPFIHLYSVSDHDKIKNKYLPKILKSYEKNKEDNNFKWDTFLGSKLGTITNYSERKSDFFGDDFLDSVIKNSLESLHKNCDYYKGEDLFNPIVDAIWWNVYQKNDFAELHNHGYGKLSGIYILELNEENKTYFTHQNEIGSQRHKTEYVKEGDVLLFPSLLNHYTIPAERRRVSISFDICIKCGDKSSWWSK